MNCGRVSNQLSAYIDRELTGAEMLSIRKHLGECEGCRAEYDALGGMKMLLGRLRTIAPRQDMIGATMRRWEGQRESARGHNLAARGAGMPRLALLSNLWERCQVLVPWRMPPSSWRLRAALATAALVAALALTGVFLHTPRHSDALIATSPVDVLEGRDPVSRQADREWVTLGSSLLNPSLTRPTDGSLPVNWVNVSLPGDPFSSSH
jgi:anti-sigma factor RsiW